MQLRQASSLPDVRGGVPIHGGTEVVPLLRAGLLARDDLVDVRSVIPAGVRGHTIGAGTTLAASSAAGASVLTITIWPDALSRTQISEDG